MILQVFAMARPSRPSAEKHAVRLAASNMDGSIQRKAVVIARAVAAAALREIDADPADAIALMLQPQKHGPIESLAGDPEIDTGAIIRAARIRRMQDRGCRHLPPTLWERENREVLREVAGSLSRRYARHLRE